MFKRRTVLRFPTTFCAALPLIFLFAENAPAQSLVIYPQSAIVEAGTKEPFTAWVNGGAGSQAVDWYVNDVPGGNAKLGTISQDGIYTAPANGPSQVTIKAIGPKDEGKVTISVSGSLPPITCNANRGTGTAGDSLCTMPHDARNRSALVHIPENFVPGKSGLLIALSGGDVVGDFFCRHSGIETLGWINYVDALPAPAPMLICPNPARIGTGPPQWNAIEFDSARFDSPPPDDSRFIRQWILWAGNHGVNLKAVGITGMWVHGGTMAYQAGREIPDLVAAVSSYDYNLRNGANDMAPGPHIPIGPGPVSVVHLNGAAPVNPYRICGANVVPRYFFTADEVIEHWAAADHITIFNTNKTMCKDQDWTGLDYKKGTGGTLDTEVVYYALVKGSNRSYCSRNAGCSPVVDFTRPADMHAPYNSQLSREPSLGATLDDVIWKFFESHPKPVNPPLGRGSGSVGIPPSR